MQMHEVREEGGQQALTLVDVELLGGSSWGQGGAEPEEQDSQATSGGNCPPELSVGARSTCGRLQLLFRQAPV